MVYPVFPALFISEDFTAVRKSHSYLQVANMPEQETGN